jgi:hypothetical protein
MQTFLMKKQADCLKHKHLEIWPTAVELVATRHTHRDKAGHAHVLALEFETA